MTWGPQETQKTIFDTLSNDATLTALLGASKIFDHVPDNTPFPFVTIGDMVWEDRGNHTWDGLTGRLQINVWYRAPGRGRKNVQEIQKRIDELLHSQDVCIDGWDIISLRRSTLEILIEPDNVTLHGVQIFNLLIGSN